MIYCVEDDINIRELIIYTLNHTGFKAKGFANSKEFFKEVNIFKPDLVLLDIMLPDENGNDILKKLRSNNDTVKIPVIMLTARGDDFDEAHGFEIGADDYVIKPVKLTALAARIKALFRRLDKNALEKKIIFWVFHTAQLSLS